MRLFRVTIRPPEVLSLEAIPAAIDEMQVKVARGNSRAKFLRHLTTLCAELDTGVAPQETSPVLTIALVPRDVSRPS